ncbi:MAG: hypothetical protein ABR915_14740, partial [Thermoguttaceae bacterium]
DQVAETPTTKFSIRRGPATNVLWGRGLPVRGVQQGNPFDPVLPVRLTMPRNGVGSGQTVLSDLDGLRNVAATLDDLKGPSGAVIPAATVQVRYAVQQQVVHYCNALMDRPPEDAKTVPVWLVVRVAKDQAPGWYVSTLNLQANGKKFSVPVQVLVTGYTLPEPKDFTSDLDLYGKYCAPPKAVCLHIWDHQCVKRAAATHESDAVPSREFKPRLPLMVALWDPKTNVVTDVEAPQIEDEGSEAFYKPLIDGVKAVVLRRGWPERCILLAQGFDNRPSLEAGRRMKQWAPYARWYLLSRFASDPGSIHTRNATKKAVAAGDTSAAQGGELLKAGKLIAIPGLEVGVKEHPWSGPRWGSWDCGMRAIEFEAWMARPAEFIDIGTARWLWQFYSPPLTYRTLPTLWGNLGRIGLDFWFWNTDAKPGFPHRIFKGNPEFGFTSGRSAVILGYASGAAVQARRTGRTEWRKFAWRQLDWVLGANPDGFCARIINAPRKGEKNHPGMSIPAAVGVPNGVLGDAADQPHISRTWPSTEQWLPNSANLLTAILELVHPAQSLPAGGEGKRP